MSVDKMVVNEEIQRINLVIIKELLKGSLTGIRNEKGLNSHTLPETVIYNGIGINRSTYSSACSGKKSISYSTIEKNIFGTDKETNIIKGFFLGLDKGLIEEIGFNIEWWGKYFEAQTQTRKKKNNEDGRRLDGRIDEIIKAYGGKENELENCNMIINWIRKLAENYNGKNEVNIKKLISEIEGIEVSKLKGLNEDVLEMLIESMQTKVDAATTILRFKRLQ